jgi:hypothetical protein
MHNVLFMAKTEFLKVIYNIVNAKFNRIISHKSQEYYYGSSITYNTKL